MKRSLNDWAPAAKHVQNACCADPDNLITESITPEQDDPDAVSRATRRCSVCDALHHYMYASLSNMLSSGGNANMQAAHTEPEPANIGIQPIIVNPYG